MFQRERRVKTRPTGAMPSTAGRLSLIGRFPESLQRVGGVKIRGRELNLKFEI
jgi:hypothetical protein